MERENEIKRRVQIMIDELEMSYEEIDDLNHDYSFEYPDDEYEDEEYYDDDEDEDEEPIYTNVISQADADSIAQDEYQRHLYEQSKKNNTGGSTPQNGL